MPVAAPAPTKTSRYGLAFPLEMDDAQIECHMIRKGGQWTEGGRTFGRGLFFHYKRLFRLYWSDEDENRWEDAILDAVLSNQFTTIMGCSGSCKTSTAAKFALCFYSVWPTGTTILISSTDLRGLEMRVFGRIKELIEHAKDRFDWFPGNVIDSKKMIATDDIDETGTRDQRHGITCFVPGTMIDTPSGPKPIESLKPGDSVFHALGVGKIKSTQSSNCPQLLRVKLFDGRSVDCTPDHPFFTCRGWTKAIDLKTYDRVFSAYEIMRYMQPSVGERISKPKTLFQAVPELFHADAVRPMQESVSTNKNKTRETSEKILFSTVFELVGIGERNSTNACDAPLPMVRNADERGSSESDLLLQAMRGEFTADELSGVWENVYLHSAFKDEASKKVLWGILQAEAQQPDTWVQPSGSNEMGASSSISFPNSGSTLQNLHGKENWKEQQSLVRSRHCLSESSLDSGTRRGDSHHPGETATRRKANERIEQAWVACVEILEPTSDARFDRSGRGYTVHNLEVEGHPSYFAGGVLVHNCIPCLSSSGGFVGLGKFIGIHNQRVMLIADELQLMQLSLLDAVPNLLNNAFAKFVFLGNPLAQNDPLDKVSEPKEGWSTIGIPKKTILWPTKYMDGVCLNLPGLDSPNWDFPADRPDRFGYMVGRLKEKMVRESYGEGSQQYCSMILGVRVQGLTARKVITREICVKFDAFRLPIWHGTGTTKIYAIDAAYSSVGGDLCVGGWIEFGKDLNGKEILYIGPQKIIPISALSGIPPDDQIALFVKQECESLDIDEENVFFDGRTMLMAAFARLWHGKSNPVDFGARPTERPVSLDLKVVDAITGESRLKLCSEHYSKFVTELWFSIRYTIESGQLCGMTEEILNDAVAREWKMVRSNLIEVEAKHEMKKRTGKSPDRTDQLATAIEGARRRGFQIAKLSNPKADPKRGKDWLDKFAQDYEKLLKSKELQHV